MNKGEKTIRDFKVKGFKPFTYYFCNRCQTGVLATDWKGDTHDTCDFHLKNLAIRQRVEKRIIG